MPSRDFTMVPHWLDDLSNEIRGREMNLYVRLRRRSNNTTHRTPPISKGQLAQEFGCAEQTISNWLEFLVQVGAVEVVRTASANTYLVHHTPFGKEDPMPIIGADPEEPERSTPPKRRERVHGGTDQVEPAQPKRRYRDTPPSLVTYFRDHVAAKQFGKGKLPVSAHIQEGALKRHFQSLLDEGYDADHIRRAILRFAKDIELKPLADEQPAWKAFLYRRRELLFASVTPLPSETDYNTETQTGALFERLRQQPKENHQ